MKPNPVLAASTCLALLLFTPSGFSAIYTSQVNGTFRTRVEQVATALGTDPDFLVAVMALETAKPTPPHIGTPTFDPSIQNPDSGAVGLIQFMSSTAENLGTTTEKLKAMTAVEQMDFVEKYLSDYKGKVQKLTDLYLAVFYPKAIGKPDDFTFPDAVYRQNKGFDVNGDGKLQKSEVAQVIQKYYDRGVGK